MAKKTVKPPRWGLGFIRRGLLGEGRWQVSLGLVLLGLSTARRLFGREEVVVWSGELDPGQVLTVRHVTEARR